MFNKSHWNTFVKIALLSGPLVAAVPMASANKPALGKRAVNAGSWVDLQTSTNKRTYKVGEPIRVTLKATNIQEKDAYLKFSSGQRYDLHLFKAGAKEPVYTWSANKMFAQMTSTIKLKMAQRETYNTEIGGEMGELAPGKYRLEAHLTNSSKVRALPIDFTVEGAANTGDARATMTATTDKRVYKVGEPVKVDFALQNNAKKATTFNFRSGQNYDVFVKNAAGEPMWNWSANKRFIMISRPITFAAGEKRNFSVEWSGEALPDHKITPGKYTVQAVYASDPEIAAPPITIEIR